VGKKPSERIRTKTERWAGKNVRQSAKSMPALPDAIHLGGGHTFYGNLSAQQSILQFCNNCRKGRLQLRFVCAV
jgi:hypothetical protein